MGSRWQLGQPNKNNPVKVEIISDEESDVAMDQANATVRDLGRPDAVARALGRPNAASLPTVQLFGSEVGYRRYGKILLFNTRNEIAHLIFFNYYYTLTK